MAGTQQFRLLFFAEVSMDFDNMCGSLRTGSEMLALQTAEQKNSALKTVAEAINSRRNEILDANRKDTENARTAGTKESMIDRLALDDRRIDGIIASMNLVISQTDPVGEELAGWKTPNGLTIRQVRVPLGTVAIIYESRPNVTVDAFCLAYKSGNSILLRGSSSAYNSNRTIVGIIKDALAESKTGIPQAVELVEPSGKNHEDVQKILSATGKIDVVLPRGSASLIKTVVENAKIPVIETGSGICHLYIDESADIGKAVNIAENAKIQRPGVCNSVECIIVNRNIAEKFLPQMEKRFAGRVQLRADKFCLEILERNCGKKDFIVPAKPEDFGCEFLDYVCCLKSAGSVEEAIEYINGHNSKHSESIITESMTSAKMFQSKVDAACVYVNASTRFTDGGEFGFGAELGISTQKLHARGPMGIKVLTTTKYLIDGDGQTR